MRGVEALRRFRVKLDFSLSFLACAAMSRVNMMFAMAHSPRSIDGYEVSLFDGIIDLIEMKISPLSGLLFSEFIDHKREINHNVVVHLVGAGSVPTLNHIF